jgi:hypothetical protein
MSTTTFTETTSTTGLQSHIFPDPPPYTPPTHGLFADATGEEDEEEDSQPTTTFVIHAPTTVHGSSNIIAVSPPDVPRLTAAVVASISQKMHLPRSFSIQINCGVNVIGDKNIVGSPAIRPLAASQQQHAAAAAVAARHGVQQNGDAGPSALRADEDVAIPMHGVKRRASEVCVVHD